MNMLYQSYHYNLKGILFKISNNYNKINVIRFLLVFKTLTNP